MEILVTLLIGVPFLVAAILAVVKNDWLRGKIVYIGGLIIAILAVITAVRWYMVGETVTFDLPGTQMLNHVILGGEFVLMFIIIWLSFKHHKGIISIFSIVQTLMIAWVELFGPKTNESSYMRIDWLAFMMILIIGIIGVMIGIYAVGYMRGYHIHHKEFEDRRSFFFSVIFLFYGAMFGLVTSMNILWLGFFWETTSVCSFLLIGYTKTQEAVDNSFRALWMNLLGGLCLAIAIVYAVVVQNTVNLYDIVANGVAVGNGADAAALIPIVMLAVAALTKSAQMPFSRWLFGAMVAPTPSSALLHSATMVKAGVYMLIRISTAMSGNYVGQMVYIIGGVTFVATSLMAIAQNDAKKVLAYSTISNLGLITACAGIGMEETIWAAVFLIIFHAVSKSMLFQCVGAIENTTGSRDIEDMQGLVVRFPKLGLILMIGIAGMFLAPFGMLISKWAALRAFVDAPSTFLVMCIVFGSSTTMFYWTKWLAKILGVGIGGREDITQRNEYASMFAHAAMIILLCLCFPVVSTFFVEPLVKELFGYSAAVIDEGSIIIMVIMVLGVFIVPLISYLLTKNVPEKQVLAYMGGANAGDNIHFIDAFGEKKDLEVSNWYLRFTFGGRKLFMPSVIFATVVIVLFISMIIGGALQ